MRPPACAAIVTRSVPWLMLSSGPGASGAIASVGVQRRGSGAIRIDGPDPAPLVVVQLRHLHRSKVGHATGEQRIVVEKIPAVLELANGMMRGPAKHRSQDHALVHEWPIGVVAHGIAQQMRIA